MIDTISRALRDGPRAFPVDEGYGTLAWFVGTCLWWRLWAIGCVIAVFAYLALASMALFEPAVAWVLVFFSGYACCEWSMRISDKYEIEQRY